MLNRLVFLVLFSVFAFSARAKEKVIPMPFIERIPSTYVSCIIDSPYKIKRYTVVATSVAGFGEKGLKYCRNEFNRLKYTSTQETIQQFQSIIELQVSISVGSLSCEYLKLSNMPVRLLIVSSLEPGFFHTRSVGMCLGALDKKMKEEEQNDISSRKPKLFSPSRPLVL